MGVLGHFLGKGLNFLVDALLEVLDYLVHDLFMGLKMGADVLGDDAVGDLHLANLHTALSHEDGFFSTERFSVGFVNAASHHLQVGLGEVTSGVS